MTLRIQHTIVQRCTFCANMCSILNALEERRKEREKQAAAKKEWFQLWRESVEKRAWKEFWDSESPGLLLYACLHGTADIVKYFVTKHVSPTTRYHCIESSTLSEFLCQMGQSLMCLHDVDFGGMYNTRVQ